MRPFWIWLLSSSFQHHCHLLYNDVQDSVWPSHSPALHLAPLRTLMNGCFLQASLVPSWPIPPLMGSFLFLVPTWCGGWGGRSLNQWLSTSIGPIPQGVLQKFVDMLIGCHMTGVILPMNFTLFQDSKEDFTRYLLHKAVISFNRTGDHCHQPPLFPSPSQDELTKHGCRI